MHRAGESLNKIGNFAQGIILKNGNCALNTTIYQLNTNYYPLVDYLLEKGPVDPPTSLSKNDWFAYYGAPVKNLTEAAIDEDDPIWIDINHMIQKGSTGIILSGPPGTSKTWYAKQLALLITEGTKIVLNLFNFILLIVMKILSKDIFQIHLTIMEQALYLKERFLHKYVIGQWQTLIKNTY